MSLKKKDLKTIKQLSLEDIMSQPVDDDARMAAEEVSDEEPTDPIKWRDWDVKRKLKAKGQEALRNRWLGPTGTQS